MNEEESSVERIVRLDEEKLKVLENQLSSAESELIASARRRGQMYEAEIKELAEATRSEIIESYRRGVKIAPHAESQPLIPLFEAAKVELPPELRVDYEQMRYRFYLVIVTFSIFLPEDQFPLAAEFGLTLKDDVKDTVRRARVIRLFPGRKDVQFFSVDVEGAFMVNAHIDIYSPLTGSKISPFPSVEASAGLRSGIVFGPLKFQFRKAAVEVRGESDQQVFWRYNLASELTGANDFKSILVLKIAEEAKSVEMAASLGVVPYKRQWMLFKEKLPMLLDNVILPVELAMVRSSYSLIKKKK